MKIYNELPVVMCKILGYYIKLSTFRYKKVWCTD